MSSELWTAAQLAKELRISVETLWKYTREDKIPYITLGRRQYRYDKNAVIEALCPNDAVLREKSPEYTGQGRLTYNDYLKLPDDTAFKNEIINGYLVREPAPTVRHQRVSRRFQRILEDFFAEHYVDFEVFDAPLDVTLSSDNVLQPDLLVVSHQKQGIIEETRINGAPELIVEILSPSSASRDRVKKLAIYLEYNVAHYWIVDPLANTLEAFRSREGRYVLVSSAADEDEFSHPDFPGLSVDLEKLFR